MPKINKKLKPKKSPTAISAPLFDINGKAQGSVNLPKEIFACKINEKLLAQAIRIYFTNQSVHSASTKTRSQIRGGGRKPWRQKGTGRARAGSIRSPLWVGGGIALGPTPRKVKLILPKKMKQKALFCALSAKLRDGNIKVISSLEKIEPKTKIVSSLLKKLQTKNDTLLVISEKNQNIKLASRNIPKVSVDTLQNLNAYEIIKNKNVFFSKEAIGGFK